MSDVDLSKTVDPKSDQLNADDLIAGPKTIKITRVTASSTPEQPVSVHFDGDGGKPWKPCKSMRRVLIALWGSKASAYIGKRLTLYRDESVKFGGIEVGGIRISHADVDADITIAITESRAKRNPTLIRKLQPPAQSAVATPSLRKQLAAAFREAGITDIAAWTEKRLGRNPKTAPPSDDELASLIDDARAGVVGKDREPGEDD